MRREYFALDVRLPAGPADALPKPVVIVEYDGPPEELRDRFTDDAGAFLSADDVDVTCRLQSSGGDDGCVVALAHRVTGEFLLEVNGDADDVGDLVESARSADDEACYRVRIDPVDGEEIVYDKQTFLVYDDEGSLLRQHSLIPSGVEL